LAADEEKQAPTEVSAEETSKEAAEQLFKIKVSDLVVQNAVALIQLGFIRIAGEQRDLAQARLAIDCLRALEPILREQVSTEMADELQSALTNMQLAFADAVTEKTEPAAAKTEGEEPSAAEVPGSDADS
jgi:preprotein translocase subunit SecB